MLHNLKIKQCYLYRIFTGIKTFEVRKNDRDFQVGDEINFLPIEDKNYDIISPFPSVPTYLITYVLSDFVGLQQDYVCLAIIPIVNTGSTRKPSVVD